MKKETAIKITDKLNNVNREFDELLLAIDEISDEAERKNLTAPVFEVFHILAQGIVKPIVQEYPELSPIKEYVEKKKKREKYAASQKGLIPLERDKAWEIYKLVFDAMSKTMDILNHINETHIEYKEIKEGIRNSGRVMQNEIMDVIEQRYWDIHKGINVTK